MNVASAQLVSRDPDAEIVDAQFHDIPHQLADGTLVEVPSIQTYNVVFNLADGSRRLETFSCGLDGLIEPAAEVYSEFCPVRSVGPDNQP